jgi:hypothetical protein
MAASGNSPLRYEQCGKGNKREWAARSRAKNRESLEREKLGSTDKSGYITECPKGNWRPVDAKNKQGKANS